MRCQYQNYLRSLLGLTSRLPELFFFSSRRRHTRWPRDWSSDVCSSDLRPQQTSSQCEMVTVSHRRGQGRSPELVSVAQVEGFSKRYGSVQALDRVDVVVEPGCIGLVGSNGAGKSTLIKLLLGLLAPDQGRASVLGHDVAADPLGVRSQVGYLLEGACLPGDVTAADFVAFMAQLGGLPPRHARERTAEVCYQVGLDEERYRAIGGFSTGMQQRVKLAVALVHDPRLLLLDEPTDGMDPQGREDMLDPIDRVRGELEIDVLVSTHLLGDVERVCDRVVMVHAGRVR